MAARKRKSKMPLSRKIANFLGIMTDNRLRWKRRTTTTRAIIHERLANLIPPYEHVFQAVSMIQSEIVKSRLANKIRRTSNRILRWGPGSNKITSTDLAKLPSELVIQIMARMNLSECSMVNTFPCSWQSIMSHPLYGSIQNSHDHPGLWRRRSRSSVSLIFGNVQDDNFATGYTLVQKDIELNKFVSIKLNLHDFNIKKNHIRGYFNPCNGLLCFCVSENESYYMCNPLSGEWVMLPDSDPRNYSCLTGFGYSPNTNQYKLVRARITYSNFKITSVVGEVYTVGGNCSGWRRMEDDTMLQILAQGDHDVALCPFAFNGVLHWLYSLDRIHYHVLCFDVETERLSSFSLPCTAGYRIEYIGLLRGCFIAWNCKIVSREKYCQLWVLTDYSVKDSWLNFGEYKGSYRWFEDVEEIIDVDDDGKKVLIVHGFGRLSYCFEASTSSTTFMTISKFRNMNKDCGIIPGKSRVTSFVPSPLSPRHLLQQEP